MAAADTAGAYRFDIETWFPRRIFDRITEVRVDAPEIIEQQAQRRKRRTRLTAG